MERLMRLSTFFFVHNLYAAVLLRSKKKKKIQAVPLVPNEAPIFKEILLERILRNQATENIKTVS